MQLLDFIEQKINHYFSTFDRTSHAQIRTIWFFILQYTQELQYYQLQLTLQHPSPICLTCENIATCPFLTQARNNNESKTQKCAFLLDQLNALKNWLNAS